MAEDLGVKAKLARAVVMVSARNDSALLQLNHPAWIKEGVRLMFRIHRKKEALDLPRRPAKKVITTSPKEWDEAQADLLRDIEPGERIYASAQPKNVEKAIRLFKERLLDADYQSDTFRHQFYHNCHKRWMSCLGDPTVSLEDFFLFDCDLPEDKEATLADLGAAQVEPRIGYMTPNGYHLLTKAFNPALLSERVRKLIHRNPVILTAWRGSSS